MKSDGTGFDIASKTGCGMIPHTILPFVGEWISGDTGRIRLSPRLVHSPFFNSKTFGGNLLKIEYQDMSDHVDRCRKLATNKGEAMIQQIVETMVDSDNKHGTDFATHLDLIDKNGVPQQHAGLRYATAVKLMAIEKEDFNRFYDEIDPDGSTL